MRRMTLAARRARQFFRRPPPPRWYRPAIYAAGGALGLLLGVSLGVWATSSGLVAQTGQALVAQALAVTARAGFAVGEVYVDGRVRTAPEELRARLGIALGEPLLGVDTDAARERLERLTWVERASVVRMLPDSLYIRLIERQPLALWQRDGRFSLIDRAGRVIEPGPDHAAPLDQFGHLRVLVGDRRWSLHLDNEIDVLLPEEDPLNAWRLLAARARDDALLDRAISVIDLRFLPSRMRLRLDPSVLKDQPA